MIDFEDIREIEDEILAMAEKEEAAKKQKAQSEGAIKIHMKQLKTDYGLKTIGEARVFVEAGIAALDEQKQSIIDDFESIKEKFNDLI